MKKLYKNQAFTLAEIMVALFISAVIAMLFLKAIRTGTNHYSNNLMSYAAFNSLATAAYDMAQVGCTSTGTSNDLTPAASYDKATTPTHPYCSAGTGVLPWWNHTVVSTVTNPVTMPNRGFCDRIAREEFNITGSIDCTKTASNSTTFKTATPNFVTTNGMRFFNFGGDPSTETATTTFYTVYIDIDGQKRDGLLKESAGGKKDVDVIKFYVSIDGNTVVPDPNSIAANDTDYLTASVKYLSGTKYVYLLTGKTYRRSICAVTPGLQLVLNGTTTIDYCKAQTDFADDFSTRPSTAPNNVTDCAVSGNTCELELDEPGLLGARNIFTIENNK